MHSHPHCHCPGSGPQYLSVWTETIVFFQPQSFCSQCLLPSANSSWLTILRSSHDCITLGGQNLHRMKTNFPAWHVTRVHNWSLPAFPGVYIHHQFSPHFHQKPLIPLPSLFFATPPIFLCCLFALLFLQPASSESVASPLLLAMPSPGVLPPPSSLTRLHLSLKA